MQPIRLRPVEQERLLLLGWENYLGAMISSAKENTGETLIQSLPTTPLSLQQECLASEETRMNLPAIIPYKRPRTTALSHTIEHITEKREIATEAIHFLQQIILSLIDECVEQKSRLPELIRINPILLFQLAATGKIHESYILWQSMYVEIRGDARLDTNTICLDIDH